MKYQAPTQGSDDYIVKASHCLMVG